MYCITAGVIYDIAWLSSKHASPAALHGNVLTCLAIFLLASILAMYALVADLSRMNRRFNLSTSNLFCSSGSVARIK